MMDDGDSYGKKAKSGAALDVIVVLPSHYHRTSSEEHNSNECTESTSTGIVASSDFFVQFSNGTERSLSGLLNYSSVPAATACIDCGGGLADVTSNTDEQYSNTPQVADGGDVAVYVNGQHIPELSMLRNSGGTCTFVQGGGLRPDSSILHSLVKNKHISPGKNTLQYVYLHDNSSRRKYLDATLFVWHATDSVIVSDIDGTITKSDINGVLDTVVREAYTHVHRGICKFFTDLVNLSPDSTSHHTPAVATTVRFLYLTSRPLSLLHSTRKFLNSLEQESCKLPPGPVFCHLGSLSEVLLTELWKRNTFEFKSHVLKTQVVLPFQAAGRHPKRKLFVAGFGNKDMDSTAYQMAGIGVQDIYIINKGSEIFCAADSTTVKTSGFLRSFVSKYSPQEQQELSIDLEVSKDVSFMSRSKSSGSSGKSWSNRAKRSTMKLSPKTIFHKSRDSFARVKGSILQRSTSAIELNSGNARETDPRLAISARDDAFDKIFADTPNSPPFAIDISPNNELSSRSISLSSDPFATEAVQEKSVTAEMMTRQTASFRQSFGKRISALGSSVSNASDPFPAVQEDGVMMPPATGPEDVFPLSHSSSQSISNSCDSFASEAIQDPKKMPSTEDAPRQLISRSQSLSQSMSNSSDPLALTDPEQQDVKQMPAGPSLVIPAESVRHRKPPIRSVSNLTNPFPIEAVQEETAMPQAALNPKISEDKARLLSRQSISFSSYDDPYLGTVIREKINNHTNT